MPILNWLTRDEDIRSTSRVPYRLLEEVPELSADDGDAGNMLIQGDNLEALKALLPFYAVPVRAGHRQLAGAQVLDPERCPSPQLVLVADRHGQVLSVFRGSDG